MNTLVRLLAAVLLAASVASPALADGRNKRAPVTAKAPPPLQIPPTPLPPPPVAPPPTPIKLVPQGITLPSDFGTGGVGIDVSGGGFGGGGRMIVVAGGSASTYARATAIAYASATAISFGGGGKSHSCGCK